MALALAELKAAMSTYTAGFDADLVAPGRLKELLGDAGAIERMAATVSALVAARLARGAVDRDRPGSAGRAGSAKAAALSLAQATGTSLGEARRATAGLLAAARDGSLGELTTEAARARAGASDLDQRRANVRAARSLREWTDPFGTWQLHARGLPEDGARVMAALGPLAEQAFAAARQEGRREAPEAYAFDALVELASGPGGGAPGYEVMVRVDHSALLRGYVIDGETCEMPGFGPVSPQVVADIMECGDPFYKSILTKGKDLVGVAHLGRRPNAHQRSALDWLYPTCAVEGCGVRSRHCQTDHRTDWAQSHVTVFELLDRLCKMHHDLKTYQGWGLVEGKGKRAFVPPEDPRHPRHGPQAAPPGPPPRPGPGPIPSPPPPTRAPSQPAPPGAQPRLL
jgi:hypothetical protein